MVGYLGAAGATLYHGPSDSAACNLLKTSNAALCCTSLDADEMAKSIVDLVRTKSSISEKCEDISQNAV